MVYKKLLLDCGYGVDSNSVKAPADPNTATLVIGIGGTGIDCLETAKTRIYRDVVPSRYADGHVGYHNILFWGIDTFYEQDEDCEIRYSVGTMALTKEERFNIVNPYLHRLSANPKGLEMRKELNWLRYDAFHFPFDCLPIPYCRQHGRFLIMDKSTKFMQQLQEKLEQLRRGADRPLQINIHIISGLSGSIGSGCFLDVCYMIKHILKKLSLNQATVFGHFFMSDVNLAAIPAANGITRDYRPRNCYASMQELDYCMRLPDNGGGFDQIYSGDEKIAWREPPVDYCNIVSAREFPDADHFNSYIHAMQSTAEYIKILTVEGWQAALENIQHLYSMAAERKKHGVCHKYYSVDAASYYLPHREINTYIASELFERFSSIRRNVPQKSDIENLAISVFAKHIHCTADIYNALYCEMCDGFDQCYLAYTDNWQSVRDCGDSWVVTNYTNQTTEKLCIAEKNAKDMASASHQNSLINRLSAKLRDLASDIQYGPMFAYELISAANPYNLLNVIDGLIQVNTACWDQETAQTSFYREDCDKAKDDFENRRWRKFFDSNAKRFGDYEYNLMIFEKHKLTVSCYALLDEVLHVFRDQVTELSDFYSKLSKIIDGLIETFAENKKFMECQPIGSTVLTPWLSVEQIKKHCSDKMAPIRVDGVFDYFMRTIFENEDIPGWQDEDRLAELVTNFFHTVFDENCSLIALLKDANKLGTEEQVRTLVFDKYHNVLSRFNGSRDIMNNTAGSMYDVAERYIISAPESYLSLLSAAELICSRDAKWQLYRTVQQNQVTFLSVAFGIPFCARKGIEEIFHSAYSREDPGRHLYEGNPIPDMPFCDWRKLPPIIPISEIDKETAPYRTVEYTEAVVALYNRALLCGVIGEDGTVYTCDKDSLLEFNHLVQKAEDILSGQEEPDLDTEKCLLQQLKEVAKIKLCAAGSILEADSPCADDSLRKQIVLDYFGLSPVMQKKAKDTCYCLDECKQTILSVLHRFRCNDEKSL